MKCHRDSPQRHRRGIRFGKKKTIMNNIYMKNRKRVVIRYCCYMWRTMTVSSFFFLIIKKGSSIIDGGDI